MQELESVFSGDLEQRVTDPRPDGAWLLSYVDLTGVGHLSSRLMVVKSWL